VIVALIPSALTLVAMQAIAGALAAPPVYGLVRARSDVTTARIAALVAWLYPPLAGLIFGDFHENGFAPAAVAWTLYAFDLGNLGAAIAGAAVTLCIKEDQALFLAIAGGLGAWHYRGTTRGRVAAGVAIASITVLLAFFALIQPHAAAATAWQPWRFYGWSSDFTFSGLAARAGFLLLIFGPLLFLPFRSPMVWLAAAPLAEVLLSRMPTTYTLGTHYAGAWIGYVLVAFAGAVRALPQARARAALYICAALCVVEFAVADPLHPAVNLRRPQARDGALDGFLRELPPNAAIATQEEAYTHLALRDPYATLLPEHAGAPLDTCFVLVDSEYPDSPRLQEYGNAFAALVNAHRYVPVASNGGITLYRREPVCRWAP
ncbi:MAG TPA: DUF2079 domain-containing protein, partial [Candidatus Nitrosotalea sp.]|nr:DUF2079 domain-containing protein [Candidatus Nitrosotalea sp.]